jgi:phosphoglycerol transferase MdoB-like AlkP superfamily enzyme
MIAVASVGAGWSLRRLERLIDLGLPRAAALACVAPAAFLIAGDLRHTVEEFVLFGRGYFTERPLRSPDYSALRVAAGESVFVLQLESVNSAVLFERSSEGNVRRRVAMPGLEAMLREGDGVLFPFFWANGMQTNRAQEAILCAISGNAGQALSADPGRLQRRTCLPRHLADAGFATVFLYSYFDLEFFNFAQFEKAMGFAELVHGSDLMARDDRRHPWGYDDCVFYERAFDYLEKRGLARRERVFAYFEVGTNHAPYGGPAKYPEAHPYPAAETFAEHYVNSVAEQDHCLKAFWKRFKALGRDDVHLIVVPDHSVWVGGTKDPDSVFTTWLAYLPPPARKADFRPGTVLAPMPSQAQIYPTVLELLGAPRSRDSFAFALRGEAPPADYDDCHLLADPYTRLVVVRPGRRAEYGLQTGTARIGGDAPHRMDYWTFHDQHRCKP